MSPPSMTPEQRLDAAIRLQPVDRVPCAPWIVSYAGQYAGVSNREFMWNWNTAMASYAKLAAAYPQWDCYAGMHYLYGDAKLMRAVGFNNYKFPGTELGDNEMYQTIETEVMSRDDLRTIRDKGLQPFYMKLMKTLHGTSTPRIIWGFIQSERYQKKEIKATAKRGQCYVYGAGAPTGNELFSLTRSMAKYFQDMFQMKGELVEILQRFNDEFFAMATKQIEKMGVRRAFVPCTRTSGAFLSKRMFEQFSWPFIKDMATRLIAKDIVPFFHMDTDWGNNIEYFLELPRGRFVMELDSATDIFRAREILGDHACIAGDIPASMLTIGSATEVDDYCRRLITEVGGKGGFILRPGCTMPMDARHANVKAMFESIDRYGTYD